MKKKSEYIQVAKPVRWDYPFDARMQSADLADILACEPIQSIDADKFPASFSLESLIRNDGAVRHFSPGEVITREGEYGQSAFFILSGNVVMLTNQELPLVPGYETRRKKTMRQLLRQLWNGRRLPEVRDINHYMALKKHAADQQETEPVAKESVARYRLKDYQKYLEQDANVRMGSNEYFGEISAVRHKARTATVIAANPVTLFEIRWQGLKEILQRAPHLNQRIQESGTRRGTYSLIARQAVFNGLTQDQLHAIDASIIHETYGDYSWYQDFESSTDKTGMERLLNETLIVAQGQHVDGLLIVRHGFVRVSIEVGNGYQPLGFLSAGDAIGIQELKARYLSRNKSVWQCSLHALGYADVIWIPAPDVDACLFAPAADNLRLEGSISDFSHARHDLQVGQKLPRHIDELYGTSVHTTRVDPSLSEFLINGRYVNGTAAMIINLERCVHCDDCVKACARAHDNNPRFVRDGTQFNHLLFASACMHCQDAPCLIDCPTSAIQRDSVDGLTLINDRTCIGCGNCAGNCPYNAIKLVSIVDEVGRKVIDDAGNPLLKASKCDYCIDQLVAPACELSCPYDALKRVNLNKMDNVAKWLEQV